MNSYLEPSKNEQLLAAKLYMAKFDLPNWTMNHAKGPGNSCSHTFSSGTITLCRHSTAHFRMSGFDSQKSTETKRNYRKEKLLNNCIFGQGHIAIPGFFYHKKEQSKKKLGKKANIMMASSRQNIRPADRSPR